MHVSRFHRLAQVKLVSDTLTQFVCDLFSALVVRLLSRPFFAIRQHECLVQMLVLDSDNGGGSIGGLHGWRLYQRSGRCSTPPRQVCFGYYYYAGATV